jgi:hypothetical protein
VGWSYGPPDWIGVGVQKSGTSWWHRLICEHPAMIGTVPKELHFFDQFWQRSFTDDDAALYSQYFPRPLGSWAGEWTPRYLLDYWVPPLIARAAPKAKIVVILRDPIERYRSGLSHEIERGAAPGPRLAQETMARGLYHRQLSGLRRCIPDRQILVLQYERCRLDPLTELRRTYEFLGFDQPDFRPSSLGRTINPSRSVKAELSADARTQLVAAYEPDIVDLIALYPEIDVSLWPNFLHLAGRHASASSM